MEKESPPESGKDGDIGYAESDDIFSDMADSKEASPADVKPENKNAKPTKEQKESHFVNGAQHFDQDADIIDSNYQIFPGEYLPDLDNSNARAVNAMDRKNPSRQIYALICNNHMPNRRQALQTIHDFVHPNFSKPITHGIVPLSSPNECRYVLIMNRPTGPTLADLINRGEKFSDKFVVKEVVAPLVQVLEAFEQRNIVHGKMNPDNVYYNEQATNKLVLGECFSEPSGSSQDDYFLPPDIATTAPIGRGDEDPSVDYFALGVLVVRLLLGFNPVQKIDKSEYIEKCMSQGVFNTIVGNREFPGMIEDLLKGLLTDERESRWGSAQINLWLGGKRFNLLRPTPPKEAPRPCLFNDKPYFNKRHLAYGLSSSWTEARTELREKRVSRWIELSAKNPELAENLTKLVQVTGGETSRLATDDDDLVSKSITLLNPYSSFRLPRFSSFISGLGATIADAVQNNNIYVVNCVNRIIAGQFVEQWSDTEACSSGIGSSDLAWMIENRSRSYQLKIPGFGVDRILYDLNPSMPCQSQLVLRHHVTSVGELLLSLDSFSSERHRVADPFDRHIMAFMCSKMGINQEIRTPVDRFPKFSKSQAIKALTVFANAQRKAGNLPLNSLTKWFHERLRPTLDNIHSRSLKSEMREEMERAVPKGNLAGILKVFSNSDAIAQDEEGFQKAKLKYARNALKIAELNQHGTEDERAEEVGMRISVMAGFIALAVALMKVTQQYVF